MATMNVRSIRLQNQREELARNFQDKGICILGIVDHKIVHEDPVTFQQFDEATMITSSAWRNTSNATVGGVGLMLSKQATQALSEVVPRNERIITAHFSGNPAISVIVHYSPTEGSDTAEEHYNNLVTAISAVPKHNVLLVLGDCNAHLGEEAVKHTYHKRTNSNGEHLLDLACEANLIITNTAFQKRKGKLWTFLSDMTGSKSQIDYILINKKWKNSVKNVEAYSSFASTGSDHRIVIARLKLSLRKCKTPPRGKKYDWKVLNDNNLQDRYTVLVRNRYAQLSCEDDTVTESYQHFMQANNEAADELIPVKQKIKRIRASKDPGVIEAREKANVAFQQYQENPTEGYRNKLQAAKENLKTAYNDIIEKELEGMIKKVEEADSKSQHGESWKLINEISGRETSKKGILKGKSQEERIKAWYIHFSNLLGKEPVTNNAGEEEITTVLHQLSIKTGPFTVKEYQAVKRKLKEDKTLGSDGISIEALKHCDFDDIIVKYANKLLIDQEKPDQWSDIHIIPLPKSGDLSKVGNYRGIGISSTVSNVINRMILNRIQPAIDEHLRPNQNGFRPNRSTSSHILALRRIIEGVKQNKLPAVITFVDFRKAFDSVHRAKMMKILMHTVYQMS